jgi:hypothetical protein
VIPVASSDVKKGLYLQMLPDIVAVEELDAKYSKS